MFKPINLIYSPKNSLKLVYLMIKLSQNLLDLFPFQFLMIISIPVMFSLLYF